MDYCRTGGDICIEFLLVLIKSLATTWTTMERLVIVWGWIDTSVSIDLKFLCCHRSFCFLLVDWALSRSNRIFALLWAGDDVLHRPLMKVLKLYSLLLEEIPRFHRWMTRLEFHWSGWSTYNIPLLKVVIFIIVIGARLPFDSTSAVKLIVPATGFTSITDF